MRTKFVLVALVFFTQAAIAQGSGDVLAFQYTTSANSIEAYEKFLNDYPKSIYVREATSNLKILKILETFRRYDKTTAISMFKKEQAEEIEKIIARYANSNDGGETARRRIDEMIRRDDTNFYNFVSRQRSKELSGNKDAIDGKAALEVYKTIYADSQLAKNLIANDRQLDTHRAQLTEQSEWTTAANSRDINTLEDFIKKYPNGTYAPYAKQAIDGIKQVQDSQKMAAGYQAAYASSDPKVIEDFLKKYPNSPYGMVLTQRLQSISTESKAKEERADFNKALLENKASIWEDFIKKYPDSANTTSAITQLRALKDPGRPAAANAPSVASVLPQAVVTPEEVVKKETRPETNKSNRIFAHRRALVIGNDGYIYVNPLANAKNDAKAVAASLEKVGYKVTLLLDQNEKSLKQALRQFKTEVEGGDEVLFFFAGHGVQIAGANYLLPTDIKGDGEDQVKDEAIQLQRLLDDMADRKTKLALAVIDACRDNPFKSSGRALGGRGLAPTTPATGQMILFSAGSGQKALDNLGPKDKDPNGLFTRTFIREIQKPGIPVDRVLKNVREKVVTQAKEVGHEQVPALYDQVIGEFYFKQ